MAGNNNTLCSEYRQLLVGLLCCTAWFWNKKYSKGSCYFSMIYCNVWFYWFHSFMMSYRLFFASSVQLASSFTVLLYVVSLTDCFKSCVLTWLCCCCIMFYCCVLSQFMCLQILNISYFELLSLLMAFHIGVLLQADGVNTRTMAWVRCPVVSVRLFVCSLFVFVCLSML